MTLALGGVPVVIALLSVGCAQVYWTKAGFSNQEFLSDRYACERDMRQSGYFGGGLVGMLNAQDFFDRCMASKGYYKVTQTQGSSGSNVPPAPSCPSGYAWDSAAQRAVCR